VRLEKYRPASKTRTEQHPSGAFFVNVSFSHCLDSACAICGISAKSATAV
jgi:hypothetical protein